MKPLNFFYGLLCCVVMLGQSVWAGTLVVGGTPLSRNSTSILFSGGSNGDFGKALQNTANFGSPGAKVPDRDFVFQEVGNAGSFSASDLQGVDVFVVGTKIGYSQAEADALHSFVLGGGSLFIHVDFDSADNANLISQKFGVTHSNDFLVTSFAVQTGAGFVTAGPFGDGDLSNEAVSFSSNATGKISSLGSQAVSVAQINPSIISMALITPGALQSGAGGVLFFSDWARDTFHEGTPFASQTTRDLILNFFANVPPASGEVIPDPGVVPEPGSLALLSMLLLCCGILKAADKMKFVRKFL